MRFHACSVPGCTDKVSKRHRFPKKEPEVVEKWIAALKNPRFIDLDRDQILRSHLVCDTHFKEEDKVPGNRGLKRSAVPSKYLPDEDEIIPPKRPCLPLSNQSCEIDFQAAFIATAPPVRHVPLPLCKPIPELAFSKLFEQSNNDGYSSQREVPPTRPFGTSQGLVVPQVAMEVDVPNVILEDDYIAGPSRICQDLVVPETEMEVDVSNVILRNNAVAGPSKIPQVAENAVPWDLTEPRTPPNQPPSTLPASTAKRNRVLKDINVTRQNQLTPRCKVLYKKVTDWGRKHANTQRRLVSFQQRLRKAENAMKSDCFIHLQEHVNKTTYKFIMQQIRLQKYPNRGRRFTLDEKILALTIFKASGKGYRFLSKIFALPSKRSLLELLAKIPMGTGINTHLMEHLKSVTKRLKKKEKYCVLIFDEMSLSSNLQYNRKEDKIMGLEDYGKGCSNKVADHANVFLIKGVYRQWKQPIGFTFSSGEINSAILKTLIKEAITMAQEAGLHVIGTICDQGNSNRVAIKGLVKEARENLLRAGQEQRHSTFLINNEEIVPLFDVPHLFKGIRNNLLTKDLHFSLDGVERVAKWKHIEQFYMLDTYENSRMCPKLTDAHIFPGKMNKMKVKLCTQVFSYTVGTLMENISDWNIQSDYSLPPEAKDTAKLILFLDELFDSLNSSNPCAPPGKQFKAGVTKTSGHEELWMSAIKILSTMKFYNAKQNRFVRPPSLSNLILTLRGFLHLRTKLLFDAKFSFILTRALNQDCIENFFGGIRSHGARNIAPDVTHFIASFKTMIIGNFTTNHSPNFNCEEDATSGALTSLKSFIDRIEGTEITEPDTNLQLESLVAFSNHFKNSRVGECTITYFAGYLAKKALSFSGSCENCRNIILYCDKHQDTDFIECRQYPKSNLTKPGGYLKFLTSQTLNRLNYYLPRVCDKTKLSNILCNILQEEINFAPINCTEHNLADYIRKFLVRCFIYFWTKRINLILKGRDKRFEMFLRKYGESACDSVKLQAHKKYLAKAQRRKNNKNTQKKTTKNKKKKH